MSYDLYFRRPSGAAPLLDDEVQAYFDGHPRYQVGNREAIYTNEATGIVFLFRWGAEPAVDEAQDGAASAVDDVARIRGAARALDGGVVHFQLAYYRSRVFALEASIELDAFAAHFAAIVDDPQKGGMGSGPYVRAGFLRGWDAGNRASHQLVPHKEGIASVTLPLAEQERCWRWNYQQPTLQAAAAAGVTVPPIIHVVYSGAVRSAVLWTDAAPILLPEVELVVLHRAELGRRRFFLFKKQSLCIVPYEAVLGAIIAVPVCALPQPHHAIGERTSALVQLFRTAPAYSDQLEVIPVYQVLDQETVDGARAVFTKKQRDSN